jgi:hypothetical protein
MSLPGIGRITSLQTGGKNSLSIRASTAGDGSIDDRELRILGSEEFDHGRQTIGLTWTNPP